MPLQSIVQSVPLFGGIDTKVDPKYLAAGKQLMAQNVRYFNVNSAQKRFGQTALPQTIGVTGEQIQSGKALGTFNNELLLFDGTRLFSYAQSANTWVAKRNLTEVLIDASPVIRSAGSVSGIASAIVSTIEIYAWEDSRGGVYYAVRDPQSGTFTIPSTQLDAAGYSPQIVITPTYTYLFYGTSTFIRCAKFATANPSGGIIIDVAISGTTTPNGPFAVTASPGGNPTILVVWQDGSSTTWQIKSLDFSLNTLGSSSVTIPGAFSARSVAIGYSTDGVFACYLVVHPTNVYFGYIEPTDGSSSSPISRNTTDAKHAAVVGLNGFQLEIYYDDEPVGETVRIHQTTLTFAGSLSAAIGPITALNGLQIASQPVLSNGVPYIVGCSDLVNLLGATSQQTSFYLCGGTSLNILLRFFGDSAFVGGTVLPALQETDSGDLFVGLAQRTALRADADGTVYSQAGISACSFSFPAASQVKISSFGTTALINCGNTYTYDGQQIVESGFWEFPDGISATENVTVGSLLAGTYSYCLVYEWTDAAGNIHYSAPSYPLFITVSAGSSVTLDIPYTALTLKPDAVVAIYRTDNTGLGPWFRIAELPNLTDGTASTQYTDTASDASILGQPLLYAPPDGQGEVENGAPPPFSMLVATKTRIFGIAQDDPTALWYTKALTPGRPAEFTPYFVQRIDTEGGFATALGALDTQVVIFKPERIQYLPGDGPNAAGIGLFGQLQPISSTTGCISAPSVLNMADGILFKSRTGICLLNRSPALDVAFGLPVQGYVGLSLSGAQAVNDQNQYRWTSTEGTALVYDYVTQRWSTYTNYDAVAYTLWQNKGARLRSTGQVLVEDTSSFLDNGAPIQMVIETSWLKPAELAQGFAAVWYASFLGTYKDAHTLNIEVAYDYLDAPAQTVVWDAATNGNLGTFGSSQTYGSDPLYGSNRATVYTAPYQVRFAVRRQVCEAIKFKIYDTDITGQSCDLSEIALQLGVIGGLNRVPRVQQV